jgi:hypothetical protein
VHGDSYHVFSNKFHGKVEHAANHAPNQSRANGLHNSVSDRMVKWLKGHSITLWTLLPHRIIEYPKRDAPQNSKKYWVLP